jgi:hypothetical protein
MNRFILLLTLAAMSCMPSPAGWSAAQNPDPSHNPPIPTVTFEQYWEAARPQDVVITVQSTGNTSYLSRNPSLPVEEPATPDVARRSALDPNYQVQFLMSEANRAKVFKLAEQAKYFNGNFDFTKHPMANTGRKTLTYADISRHFQTVYNYSENKAIQGLTGLFQNISTTLEFGRKLAFTYKYDKLGLDADLAALEDAAQNHNLDELHVIAPVLQQIASDPTVLNIAREKAKKILRSVK